MKGERWLEKERWFEGVEAMALLEEERWLNVSEPDCKPVAMVRIRLLSSPWQILSDPRWIDTWDGTVQCAGL